VVYSGSGAITGVASVVCYPNAIWVGNAAISASVTVSANGQIIGEEWADVPAIPNTWTEQSQSSNIWTTVNAESNTWFSSKLLDPYVEIDYWEDGYVDDQYDYWTRPSSQTNTWMRQ
jgi:hypothetical protein